MKPINVVGLGYIGLPTALMLCASGRKVVGSDINSELVVKLRSRKVKFEEAGLSELYEKALAMGIEFSSQYIETDIYIVSVPTPFKDDSKRIDPSHVISAVGGIAEICDDKALIIIESTISPGTVDKYIRPLLREAAAHKQISVAHAPERVIPGRIVEELRHNARTIGVDDAETGTRVKEIYSSFCEGEFSITDIKTAEITKIIENAFRDVNIAFANELAKICRAGELDIYEAIEIANKHPRVNILTPGPGVGGHCIPVDPWFIVGDFPELAVITRAARSVNDSMPEYVADRMLEIMKAENIEDFGSVGLYGLTYKENAGDVRESPALTLLKILNRRHITDIKTYDPYVKEDIAPNQYHDLREFVDASKLIVIMAGHREIAENEEALAGKVIFDTRNILKTENAYHL